MQINSVILVKMSMDGTLLWGYGTPETGYSGVIVCNHCIIFDLRMIKIRTFLKNKNNNKKLITSNL